MIIDLGERYCYSSVYRSGDLLGRYNVSTLVFYGTKIAEIREHVFLTCFSIVLSSKTVVFLQSGLKAKIMPEKTKVETL